MRQNAKIRIVGFVLLSFFFLGGVSFAKSAKEIDASVDTALDRFKREVFGAKDVIAKSKAVLVLPGVVKAGIGIGGSFGFQLGVQVKSVYLFFMEDNALRNFRYSDGWQAGVDGSIALIKVGASGSVDTTKTNEPILAYALGQKGLMYNMTLEGTKFNKIKPD